jgi:transcriptional regulator with XRE-family HTH domain
MEQQQTLGDRIRFARLMKRWNQTRLAKEIGCSRNTVAGWENSLHYPSPVLLEKLAYVLGVTVEGLEG